MKLKFFLTLLLLFAASVATAYDFEVDGIYYDINGNNATVTSGTNKYSGKVTIPEAVTYNGNTYPVTTIGRWSFQNCQNLTGVTIPNSVIVIGNGAFWECRGLTSITIPNSVTIIEVQGFAFCSGLSSLTIPASLTFIDQFAFEGCSGLTSITVDSDNPVYDSRDGCNAIIKTKSNELIYGCQNSVIPNTVTNIGSWAFNDCRGLMSVTIPNSVTTICDHAFLNCSGLTSVTIPNSVTFIGHFAFAGCSSLTSVNIPSSVTLMGYNPFSDCQGLESITVDPGNRVYDSRDKCNAIIKTASNMMLTGCQNTTIPTSVTSLDRDVFSGCSSLTTISIPSSVNEIGRYAFNDCNGLTDVYSHITDLDNLSIDGTPFSSFRSSYSGRTLHVPQGTAAAYQADEHWYPYFGQIVEDLQPDCRRGDVNSDREVNIVDVNIVSDVILGTSLDDETMQRADVNEDGSINVSDINVIIAIILDGDEEPEPLPEWVDLGLPSGSLWATCNVGASSPEQYGDYFAWGETETKDYYDTETYKWYNSSDSTLTKYCTDSQYGTVDNKTELDPEDDAATVNMGPSWRMPSQDQMKELINCCIVQKAKMKGVSGLQITGPNGNTIFLPAAGYRSRDELSTVGFDCNYWTRTLTSWPVCASYLFFNSMEVYTSYGVGRVIGNSVRAVRVSQQ